MQQTTNYNLNLPEGTDVVNPLVDYNPNFSTIDSAMKANADRTVGRATCIKSGTTHVVTRSNTGSNIINFTATGDWNEGDTMTIDSTLVSVFLPDGSAALDGAYLINSEVFGILNGTRFTLYSNVVDTSELTAAIDDLAALMPNIKTISFTSPVEVGTSTLGTYPEGFTKDNCVIVSAMTAHSGQNILEIQYFAFGLVSGGVTCYANEAGRLGDTVTVTLLKIS